MYYYLNFFLIFVLLSASSCEFTEEELREIYQIKNYYINQVQIPKRSGFLIQKDFLFFNPEKYLGSFFIYTNNLESRHSIQHMFPLNKRELIENKNQSPGFENEDSIISIIRLENFFDKNPSRDFRHIQYHMEMYHLYQAEINEKRRYKMLYLEGRLQGYLQSHLILNNTHSDSEATERVMNYIKNNNNSWDYLSFIITAFTYRESSNPFCCIESSLGYENSSSLNFYNGVFLKNQLEQHYLHTSAYMNKLLNNFIFREENNKRIYRPFYLLIRNRDIDSFIIRRPSREEFQKLVAPSFNKEEEIKYISNILLPFYDKKINDLTLFKEINHYVPIEDSYSIDHRNKKVDFYFQRYYSHK